MTNQDHVPRGYTLITGASSGIGLELAKVFAEKGHDLILVARTKSKLDELGSELSRVNPIKVKTYVRDLTKVEDCEKLKNEIAKDDLPVEVLVNNAGFGLGGEFTGQDPLRQLEMIDLNVSALTFLCRLFLPAMLQNKSGYVMNVASTAAFVPGPLMAVYYATKAYVVSLSEALSSELEGSGVSVTALCPGPTRTEFQNVAKIQNSKLFKQRSVMEARDVALFAYKELMKRTRLAIPGVQNWILARSVPFAPRSLLAKTVKKLNLNRTS